MKKTLIAMAVAGVVSAPVHADFGGSAAMGIWDNGTDTTVGGILVLNGSGEAKTDGGNTVYGNVSLSFSGQEPYTNANAISVATTTGSLAGSGTNWFTTGVVVGIKGDFGNVSIGDGGSGAHLAQFAGDRHDVTRGGNYRNAIGYTNTFGDITFRVTQDPKTDGESSFGVQGAFGGVTVGLGQEADDTVIGAKMSFGDIGLAVHSTSWDVADDSSVAIKVSYSAGAVSASFQTEELSDNTKSQLDVSYSLGGGAAVSLRNRTDDTDSGEYTRVLLSVGF